VLLQAQTRLLAQVQRIKNCRRARGASGSDLLQYDSVAEDDERVDRWVARYPPAEISPDEFERFVADVLRTGEPGLQDFKLQSHEIIEGVDGSFDFDSTVRYRFLGLDFLVVVEAKCHSNPIKREIVQVLHSKAQSVGAHKAVLISTAPFQRGAVTFAKTHGIALVLVTETRFTYETYSATGHPTPSRERAAQLFGAPTFVGVYFGPAHDPGSTVIAIVGTDDVERVQELLLAVPAAGTARA
jgi:hypothetical protein